MKPASPPLNGKAERSQRTDIEEFYSTVDLTAPDLPARLQERQDHDNPFRSQRITERPYALGKMVGTGSPHAVLERGGKQV